MATPRTDATSVRGGFTTLSSLGQTHPASSPRSASRGGNTSLLGHRQPCRATTPLSASRCDIQSSVAPQQEEQDENTNFIDSNIYLSVYGSDLSGSSKRIGIAYLNAESEVIHVGEFVDPDGFILNSTKSRLAPKVIITQARPDEDFFECLQQDCDGNDSMVYNVQTVRRSEFNYDGSLNRLKLIHIRELESNSSESQEQYVPGTSEFSQAMKLMSIVSLEKRNMICALGGLLSYIQKNNVINQLEDRNQPLSILAIAQMEFTNTVIVDDTTLRALCIFQSEFHPVGSTSGKEGLSVFKLLDETRTTQGRKLLRAWLLAPTTDLAVIHGRQEAISALLDPRNEHWFAEISLRLSSIKDVKRLVSKLENIHATCSDWILLTESIQQFISLRELANNDHTNFCLLNIIKDIWDDEILELNNLLTSVIDFTESKLLKRLEIRSGISPELDKMKYNYEQLGVFLTSVAEELVASSPTDLQHLEVLQLPQLGHLIAVPVDPNRSIEEQKSAPSFDFQFYAEDKLFFKNDRTRELDQEIGDIRGVILDIEASFVRELAERVIACKSQLITLSSAVAEIDCLLSLAKAASIYNLTRPHFINEKYIEIRNGFHFVQGQTLDQFIPNDTYLGDSESSRPMMLITGPNRSGKSIFLKQVGIIVYLAHCGSFVPAENAVLGFVDQIFCRIDLQETAMSSLSTFATDCNQISRMLRHATPSSLLLLDEFGKGTCKEDGIALLTSVIHYFGNRDSSEIPRAIITTHFHELFTLKLLPDQENFSPISFYKMDVITKAPQENVRSNLPLIDDQVTFLYKLVPGVSMNSYGLDCAVMAGIPAAIIKRAKQVSEAYMNQQPIHRINTDGTGYENLYESFINLDLNNPTAVDEFVSLIMTV